MNYGDVLRGMIYKIECICINVYKEQLNAITNSINSSSYLKPCITSPVMSIFISVNKHIYFKMFALLTCLIRLSAKRSVVAIGANELATSFDQTSYEIALTLNNIIQSL